MIIRYICLFILVCFSGQLNGMVAVAHPLGDSWTSLDNSKGRSRSNSISEYSDSLSLENSFIMNFEESSHADELFDSSIFVPTNPLAQEGMEIYRVLYTDQGLICHSREEFIDVVRALIYFLYDRAAQKGQKFEEGAFNLDDPDGRLFNFLMSSFEGNSVACRRPSSHLKAYKINQYGLDILDLPDGKRHLLFGQYTENRIFIKPENYGLSPKDFAGHTIEYAGSLLRKSTPHTILRAVGMRPDDHESNRKERVPHALLEEAYRHLANIPDEVLSREDKKVFKQLMANFGIGKIVSIFEKYQHYSEIGSFVENIKNHYPDWRKRIGNEVILEHPELVSATEKKIEVDEYSNNQVEHLVQHDDAENSTEIECSMGQIVGIGHTHNKQPRFLNQVKTPSSMGASPVHREHDNEPEVGINSGELEGVNISHQKKAYYMHSMPSIVRNHRSVKPMRRTHDNEIEVSHQTGEQEYAGILHQRIARNRPSLVAPPLKILSPVRVSVHREHDNELEGGINSGELEGVNISHQKRAYCMHSMPNIVRNHRSAWPIRRGHDNEVEASQYSGEQECAGISHQRIVRSRPPLVAPLCPMPVIRDEQGDPEIIRNRPFAGAQAVYAGTHVIEPSWYQQCMAYAHLNRSALSIIAAVSSGLGIYALWKYYQRMQDEEKESGEEAAEYNRYAILI